MGITGRLRGINVCTAGVVGVHPVRACQDIDSIVGCPLDRSGNGGRERVWVPVKHVKGMDPALGRDLSDHGRHPEAAPFALGKVSGISYEVPPTGLEIRMPVHGEEPIEDANTHSLTQCVGMRSTHIMDREEGLARVGVGEEERSGVRVPHQCGSFPANY